MTGATAYNSTPLQNNVTPNFQLNNSYINPINIDPPPNENYKHFRHHRKTIFYNIF